MIHSNARSGQALPGLHATVPVARMVALPTDSACSVADVTPEEPLEIVVTTTDFDVLKG